MRLGDKTDHVAVAEFLFGLRPRGTKLGVDRMRLLADALGHPERTLPVIHVAGTNGKGSVAAMIESILRACGWKVGLYTSPHLVDVCERVRVNRQQLTSEELAAFVAELNVVADQIAARAGEDDRPSFFEYMTAMALLHFGRTQCDIAVLETGLGGEFDATNIVTPEVSVITAIGLGHCEWLGSSIEEIAKAKAGIIKPLCPLVIGRLLVSAERVVRDAALRVDARVISVRETFGENAADYPETNLAGAYQRWNAGTATLAVRALDPRWRINEVAVAAGLRAVDWPGRWQRVRIGGRPVILDASHNPEGAAALEENLAQLVAETGRPPVVIVGVLGVDRARPLVTTICRHASEICFVVPNQPRATSQAELEGLVPVGFQGRVSRGQISELFPGGDVCTAGGAEDTVVVTGSIYLLGEVMTRLRM